MTKADNWQLVRSLRRGDRTALDIAFGDHGTMVYNACLRILGRAAAAEDATQTVFVVLMRKAGKLPRSTVLAAWLYKTAVYACHEIRRAEKRREYHERKSNEMRDRIVSKEEDNTWKEIKPELDNAVSELPDRFREVVVLTCLDGHSKAETAEILGVPLGTVNSRFARAMDKLRNILRKRNLVLSTSVLVTLLATRTAEAAAPAAIMTAVAASGAGGAAVAGAAGTSIAKIVEGTMSLVFWTKAKVTAAVVIALVAGSAVSVPVASHYAAKAAKAENEKKTALLEKWLSDIDRRIADAVADRDSEIKPGSPIRNLRQASDYKDEWEKAKAKIEAQDTKLAMLTEKIEKLENRKATGRNEVEKGIIIEQFADNGVNEEVDVDMTEIKKGTKRLIRSMGSFGVDHIVKRLEEKCDLTPYQADDVKQILKDSAKRRTELISRIIEASMKGDESEEEVEDLKKELLDLGPKTDEELAGVLTPEQMEEYKKMRPSTKINVSAGGRGVIITENARTNTKDDEKDK
ncbi:MAG: sigma-70 family RNA polymerase sigma factor [Planctomycetota bacterium]|nr:MAG: sigma-70 family RNA polymerase sigma factor [Planctomycetota bacterium]